jgi:hypothetical protein
VNAAWRIAPTLLFEEFDGGKLIGADAGHLLDRLGLGELRLLVDVLEFHARIMNRANGRAYYKCLRSL